MKLLFENWNANGTLNLEKHIQLLLIGEEKLTAINLENFDLFSTLIYLDASKKLKFC